MVTREVLILIVFGHSILVQVKCTFFGYQLRIVARTGVGQRPRADVSRLIIEPGQVVQSDTRSIAHPWELDHWTDLKDAAAELMASLKSPYR